MLTTFVKLVRFQSKKNNPKRSIPQRSIVRKRDLCVLFLCFLSVSSNLHIIWNVPSKILVCFSVELSASELNNFPLCKNHYNVLWRYMFESKCCACHSTFRSTSKTYICTSLDMGLSVATEILTSIHGDDDLVLSGYLCNVCYLLVSRKVFAVNSLLEMKTSFQNTKLSLTIREDKDVQ